MGKAYVIGDVNVDWHFYQQPKKEKVPVSWIGSNVTYATATYGGPAFIAHVLQAVVGTGHEVVTHEELAKAPELSTGLSSLFLVWEDYSGGLGAEQIRIRECIGAGFSQDVLLTMPEGLETGSVLIVNDAGWGVRSLLNRNTSLTGESTQVVYKLKERANSSSSASSNPLLERLTAKPNPSLTVLLPIEDLRQSGVAVSRAMSWERTSQDIIAAFLEPKAEYPIKLLQNAKRVIITCGSDACIIVEPADQLGCTIITEPYAIEGTFTSETAGNMVGTDSIYAAALAGLYLELPSPSIDQLRNCLARALQAVRVLHRDGYSTSTPLVPCKWRQHLVVGDHHGLTEPLHFPTQRIAEIVRDGSGLAASSFVPLAVSQKHQQAIGSNRSPAKNEQLGRFERLPWTFMEDIFQSKEAVIEIGKRLLLEGPDEIVLAYGSNPQAFPGAKFDQFVTFDRTEIESFRNLAVLIGEYVKSQRTKPLNLAVFGPPGSGKSFAIEEVAKAMRSGHTSLTFNLSQFNSPSDLLGALHQVRDVVLSGKLPLVFWDEFDTDFRQPFGWLSFFLAPMQDGKFQEGALSHPVGKAVFVFAGGRFSSFDQVPNPSWQPSENDSDDHVEKCSQFINAKGIDFRSRLHSAITVQGPNANLENERDASHILRRALLIRGLLKKHYPNLFVGSRLQIDQNVMEAFLRVPAFTHGARSLEAILLTSELQDKTTFKLSSLPAHPQLSIHVDNIRSFEDLFYSL